MPSSYLITRRAALKAVTGTNSWQSTDSVDTVLTTAVALWPGLSEELADVLVTATVHWELAAKNDQRGLAAITSTTKLNELKDRIGRDGAVTLANFSHLGVFRIPGETKSSASLFVCSNNK
jgi:hypothetical protein